MLSSILKSKNFSFLAACISNTDLLLPHVWFKSQRTVFTAKILFSDEIKRKDHLELNMHECISSVKDPKDLGKIVSLDLDEINLNDSGEYTKKVRKKRAKKLTRKIDGFMNNNVEPLEQDDDNSFIEKNLEENERNEFDESNESKKLKFSSYKQEANLLRSIMSQLKSRKGREKEEKIILEGKRLIHDACSAGFVPSVVFFSRTSDVEKFNLPSEVKLIKVPYKILQLWSNVVTTQGVIGVFEMPNLALVNENSKSIPLTIICDNIREPGNMGCILRLVAGVGCKKLILTKGCVDIWEPKVLRAAAGAHFRLPILKSLEWNEIEAEVTEKCKIVLADTEDNIIFNNNFKDDIDEERSSLFKTKTTISNKLPLLCYNSVQYGQENVVIVIGGETQGLSKEAYEFAAERQGIRVFIPMSNDIESLNNAVALGILSYEVRRQMEKITKNHFQNELDKEKSYDCLS